MKSRAKRLLRSFEKIRRDIICARSEVCLVRLNQSIFNPPGKLFKSIDEVVSAKLLHGLYWSLVVIFVHVEQNLSSDLVSSFTRDLRNDFCKFFEVALNTSEISRFRAMLRFGAHSAFECRNFIFNLQFFAMRYIFTFRIFVPDLNL